LVASRVDIHPVPQPRPKDKLDDSGIVIV